jgi:putative glycosyltransferase (TIGR04372 family)
MPIRSLKLRSKRLLRLAGGLFLILFIRAFSIIYPVKMKVLVSNRIGHFCSEINVYLSRISTFGRERAIHLFDFDYFVSNKQLARMYKRKILIIPCIREAVEWNSRLPNAQNYLIEWRHTNDIEGVQLTNPPIIEFTKKEIREGTKIAEKLSIPLNKKIIVFFNRDSRYLDERSDTTIDYGYHDYRDFSIFSMLPAMQAAVKAGYFVVRIGRNFKETLPPNLDQIVDVTNLNLDDLFDIFIVAQSEFVVGTAGGLYQVGAMFRKPILHTNFVPLVTLSFHKSTTCDFFIPKKYFSKKLKRCLTASEISEIGGILFGRVDQYEQNSIDLISNTPKEIEIAVKEMIEVVNGTDEWSSYHQELQERFWQITTPDVFAFFKSAVGQHFYVDHEIWSKVKPYCTVERAFSRIGKNYLTDNQWITK